jgi:hypothetical protein
MRPDELLITHDVDLAERVKAILGRRLAVSAAWDGRQLPRHLLIVDISDLSRSAWQHMKRWSRQNSRASLVLIDDGCVDREHLATVTAEVLVPAHATDAGLKARIEEYEREHPFRVAAQMIRNAPELPHPLRPFLAAAFTTKCKTISTLAMSLGMSQSTLRNQWVRYRSDPAMRLEDVLHRIADTRNARKEDRKTLHSSLQQLVTTIIS